MRRASHDARKSSSQRLSAIKLVNRMIEYPSPYRDSATDTMFTINREQRGAIALHGLIKRFDTLGATIPVLRQVAENTDGAIIVKSARTDAAEEMA